MSGQKPPVGTVRLKRIESDLFDTMTQLTKVRTTRPVNETALREVATRLEAVTAHVWQIANELEDASGD